MSPNFGSEGFWRGLGCLVIIGLIAISYFIGKLIIWMFDHISIEF